jgi:hypothetical protein
VFAQDTKCSNLSNKLNKQESGQANLNVFQVEGGEGILPTPRVQGQPEKLAQLSDLPPWQRSQLGVGGVLTNSDVVSTIIWSHLRKMKLGRGYPENVPDPINSLRETIVTRAERDRVVVTDELIDLSNRYREHGFCDAADECLGIAVRLLDYGKNVPGARLINARIGELGSDDPRAFKYSPTKKKDLGGFHSQLSAFEQHLNEAKYSEAATSLISALRCLLYQPLIKDEVQEADIGSKVNQLKPFISKEEWTALAQTQTIINERQKDLSGLYEEKSVDSTEANL